MRNLRLGDVAKVVSGNSAPQEKGAFDGGTFPFIRTSDVGRVHIGEISDSRDRLPESSVASFRTFPIGTILFPKSGASTFLNHRVITTREAAISSHLAGIIPNQDICLPDFLFHLLATVDARGLLQDQSYPSLSLGQIESIPVVIPPIDEQRKIIAKLNKVVGFIKMEHLALTNESKLAKDLAQAILAKKLMNVEGAHTVPLKEIAELRGRIGWKGLTAKEYVKEGPRFLSVHCLNYGHYVDYRDAFNITQERYDESPEIILQENDILICKDGAGIGKLGMVPALLGPTTINSSLLLIRSSPEVFHEYLYLYLLSPMFQSIVQERLSGSTTPHLYQRDIAELSVLLPPIQTQRMLVEQIWSAFKHQEEIQSLALKKIELFESLRNAFLSKSLVGVA